jgi:amino acid adenylation domain-containing protein
VEVEGPLNEVRIRAAIEQIVHRHKVLRTRFVEEDGIPIQIVRDSNSVPFISQSFIARGAALDWIRDQIEIPFDLARDTLIRVAIAKFDADRCFLLVNMHHIISDGWSMKVFLDELEAFYSQPDSSEEIIPPLAIQYLDFAENQSDQKPDPKGIAYWEDSLADFQETQLDTDFIRSGKMSGKGEVINRIISNTLNLKVSRLCENLRVVPSTFWLAVLFALLRKRGLGDDLCIGMPVAGRSHPQLDRLIGFFVNTVVVRLQERERSLRAESIAEYLQHIGKLIADSLEHQNIRIEDVFAKIRPERRLDQSPIFQVLYNYAAVPVSNLRLGDCLLHPIWLHNATSKFELTFSISEMIDGSCSVAVEYATDLFTRTTVTQILDQFQLLAEQILFDPDSPVASLHLGSNGHEKIAPPSLSPPVPFAEAFSEQVAKRPHAIAIEFGEEKLSYRELSLRVAAFEIAQLNFPVVAIAPLRGPTLICQCIAALMAGKPFTLDDAFMNACLKEDTAYVLPTSGSTGDAKGVAVSRQSMDTHNEGFRATFQLDSSDRIAQYATPTFDLFIEEVFPALRSGATIVLVPDDIRLDMSQLARWVRERRITVLDLPTAVFHALVKQGDDCCKWLKNLRLVIVGGEKLSSDAVAGFSSSCPSVALWNSYGPTEATIICAVKRCDTMHSQSEVAIGGSFAGAELIVVDPDGKRVPSGVVGELVISGPGVAQGYVLDGKIVRCDGFRAHPVHPNRPSYWTGDRVRVSIDGELFFRGRFDDQVKIRGHRIEPEEVAAWIARDKRVEEIAVVSNREEGEAYLIAAMRTQSGFDELRRDLTASMPAVMRPRFWLPVESIPINTRGKVDRGRILQMAHLAGCSMPDQDSFQTETQRKLRELWSELISHTYFTIDDSFFDVGGHSLLTAQLAHRIERSFGVRLPLLEIFRNPTIRMLAERIETTAEVLSTSSLSTFLPCKDSAVQALAVIMPGLPGVGGMYYALAQSLQEECNVLLLSMPGFQGDEPSGSLDETAERWYRVIIEQNRCFPTTIIAHSYSGSILCRLLDRYASDSISIERVVLIDCWPHDRTAMAFHEALVARLDALPVAMKSEVTKVVEASLAAEPLRVQATIDVRVDLVVADSSRHWLNAKVWEKYFRQVDVFDCPGDHFSMVRPPGYRCWLDGLSLFGEFKKGMNDVE